MGLEIIRPEKEIEMAFECDRRLYLTPDKSRVVEEGDKAASFLFAVPGQEISEADVEAYGLTQNDGKVVVPAAAPEPEKSKAKPEDKSREKAEDKSAKKPAEKAAGKK